MKYKPPLIEGMSAKAIINRGIERGWVKPGPKPMSQHEVSIFLNRQNREHFLANKNNQQYHDNQSQSLQSL